MERFHSPHCPVRIATALCFLLATLSLSAQDAGVNLDSDGDGMLDAWEILHFGALDHPKGDASADPDEDRCTNLDESIGGTDPLDADDCFNTNAVELTPKSLALSWKTVLGKRYQIEFSKDLQNWITLGNAAGTKDLNFFGTGETLTVSLDDTGSVVTGGVTREVWYHGLPNGSLNGLHQYINPTKFQQVPGPAFEPAPGQDSNSPWLIRDEVPSHGKQWLSSLKGPSNEGDRYGDRWRGFIVPKKSGTYHFYIASRHQSDFWLDTTDNTEDGIGLTRRCFLHDTNLTEEEDWDYLASLGVTDTQKSAAIKLEAGKRYYFQIHHNHYGQWDHLAVGWKHDSESTIEVVPGDCLSPLNDFVTYTKFSNNNFKTLAAGASRRFVRVKTFGPLHPMSLDADEDQVSDDVENILDGYQFYRAQSAYAGSSDGVSLSKSGVFKPDNDVIEVRVPDPFARETRGSTNAGIPLVKDVIRFHISRVGSLAPQTILFDLTGPSDPTSKGTPEVGVDYVVEDPFGEPIESSDGVTYAVRIPFGGTNAVIEIRSHLDEIVEYPEELNLELTAPATNYQIGALAQGTGEIHDAPDNSQFNKYYIATFSKDDAAVTATSASGSTLLVLNGSNRIATVHDYFENLTSPQTNTHLHKANLDPDGITLRAGPIVESITDDGTENGNPLMGPVSNYQYVIEPRAGFTVQDIINSLEFDNPKQGNPVGTTPLYNNKHSEDNGSGEIWAIYQRRPASELSPEEDGRVPPTPPIEPIDPVTEPDKLQREVTRFLTQATFGPTEADVEELIWEIVNLYGGDRIAAYDAWLTAQWALPQTLVRDLTHATDMQELVMRGYFDPTRNQNATVPPVAPSDWPSWPSQDISNFDSLQISTWQAPDAPFPLTGQQENELDDFLGSPNHNNRRRAQWTIMANAQDQLRQRVGFSLSEILVISEELNNIRQHHIAAARWIDMLAENADDHYREVLEDVTYSPLMGKYLSSLQNSSEVASGVPPDENYAREIMQLFTIGLFEMWDDGFVKLDATEWNIIPTYDNDDIKELARVMTGLSWSTNSAADTNWHTPNLDRTNPPTNWYDDGPGNLWYSSRFNYPMAIYPAQHDDGVKVIAGNKTIDNDATVDGRYTSEGDKDLRDVHNYFAGTQHNTTPKTFAPTWSNDASVNHPNTPVFVCRLLLQRLVTSNPSNAYLYRVVQVWKQSNGKLDQVVRAILLDPEARNLSASETNPEYGKKKEPIVAWIQALRAVSARSRITFDGTVIAGDPILLPNQTHTGMLSPAADGDLRNFGYPQSSINKFRGVPAYDANGQLISTGPGTYQRHPGTSYRIGQLDGGGTVALGQSPLKAPTVFNWFLPDYQPGGLIASYGLVAPEFQIATESSVFQNINTFWQSHWGTSGFSANTMGGTNQNSDLAGYGTILQNSQGNSTNRTDDNIIPDYTAWFKRYQAYPIDPNNNYSDEQDRDLQLIDDLDKILLAGRFALLYPIDPTDDGNPVQQGGLTHYPGRNPREVLFYYLTDTYNPNSEANIWNKVRGAFYLMTTSPEYLIQK